MRLTVCEDQTAKFWPVPWSKLAILLLLFPNAAGAIDFAHEVVPIFKEHCAECHGGDKAKGGFSLNTRSLFLENHAAVPGKAAESTFLHFIEESDPESQMPPEKKSRVRPEQIAILKRWVDAGMPWEEGFTFGKEIWEPPLKPRLVELPAAREGRDHPVDRILDADLADRNHPLPQATSDAVFLRRARLDITGLLPSPDELEAFLKDASPEKRIQKIDALLADDIAYADHWFTTWNDLLRNDYTGTGFITGGRKQITSWLYSALRQNKPYDQFTRELIAPSPDSAGFIEGIKWRGDVNASQTVEIQFSQNISQVFLGINMKCASCHDSFIDRWKLEEAYNLAAIFSDQPLELNRCDKPNGVMASPKWIFPELGDIDPAQTKPQRLSRLAELMTHPENGRFSRTIVNRIWERLSGRGIVHPVDAMDARPWNEDLLDYLAFRFAEDGYDLKKLIRLIMTSNAYQSRCVILEKEPGEGYAWAGPMARRMSAEQFLDSIWQITEAHPTRAEAQVDRTLPMPSEKSAVALNKVPVSAKWIWHQGETGTKSQLRKRITLAEAPSLFQIMATCDNAFVMKINGKKVATSRDWQKPIYAEVSRFFKKGDNLVEVDAEMFGGACGFIGQFSYLEGRQQKLIVTGQDWEARPPKSKEWSAAAELQSHGQGPWGAILDPSIIPNAVGPAPPVRAALVINDFLMRSLGRPHRDQVVTSRPGELTPLQAIDLANGDILAGYLQQGASHLLSRVEGTDALSDWLYRFALSRPPGDGEKAVLRDLLGEKPGPTAVEDLLWLIFMEPEFQMIR